MALSELISIVAPPAKPTESGGASQIAFVEEVLGMQLPRDYYAFANAYGTGMFPFDYPGSIDVRNPFSAPYFQVIHEDLNLLRFWKPKMPEWVPYPIFPEPGGLFPWGHQQDGTIYFG